MQETPAASEPSRLPAKPLFPITGPAHTPREGRLSSPIGWGGTPNLTNAQALSLRKEQKQMQEKLTNDAITTAGRKVSKAMHASGTAPKLMYRNDYRAVHVKRGDAWRGIHRSHCMKRCDYTAFRAKCGCPSRGNRTSGLHSLCKATKLKTKYAKDMKDRSLLKVKYPYRDNWKSGTDRKVLCPPCDLLIYEDGEMRHTKCRCTACL